MNPAALLLAAADARAARLRARADAWGFDDLAHQRDTLFLPSLRREPRRPRDAVAVVQLRHAQLRRQRGQRPALLSGQPPACAREPDAQPALPSVANGAFPTKVVLGLTAA